MKKTAVEWFAERIQSDKIFNFETVLSKAKEMEKEQIMNAMDWIMNKYFEFHEQPTTSAREQYYNETFKSDERKT